MVPLPRRQELWGYPCHSRIVAHAARPPTRRELTSKRDPERPATVQRRITQFILPSETRFDLHSLNLFDLEMVKEIGEPC